MDKNKLFSLFRLVAVPVLLILLGLILIMNPDAASVVIARILGWGLIAGAVLTGISAIFTQSGRIGKGIFAVGLAVVGGLLHANPLILAAWVGRIIGALILINSLTDLIWAKAQEKAILLHGLAAIIGAVLLLLPMATSRIVFSLCGVVVLIIGIALLLNRSRSRKALDEPEDPNIIDAL